MSFSKKLASYKKKHYIHGMKCPFCNSDDTQVKDSRTAEDGRVIRRRRNCNACDKRFTTFERFQVPQILVLKRNNEQELFDRDKLAKSITTAMRKRAITPAQLESIVSDIEQNLTEGGASEVDSQKVGDEVLNVLKHVDFIGYIRYASVYRSISSPEDLERLIDDVKEAQQNT